MRDVSQLTFCVVDFGLFFPVAQRLARDSKRVLFNNPAAMKGFQTLNESCIGDGFGDVEMIDEIWQPKYKNEVDVWVFPDVNPTWLQVELESQGKRVWGARTGTSLELNRELFHKTLGELGLDVPPHKRVMGVTKLREYLRDKKNVYLKISRYRGSMETRRFRSWDLDEPMLDRLAVKFGPLKDAIPFLVLDEIETDMEVGCDTYSVGGKWPSLMLHGSESKDKGYFAAATKREDMPEELSHIFDAFGPVFAKHNVSSQFSAEVRVTEKEAYFIDPTMRGGMPSTSSQMELWKNFTEIIAAGSEGELIDPETEDGNLFSAEVILNLKCDPETWGVCTVPKSLERWMKLSNCCEHDNRICFPHDADHDGNAIGWLVAVGKTPQETLETIKGYAEELPPGVTAEMDSLVDVLKEIHAEEADGIPFTEQIIPEPEEVIA